METLRPVPKVTLVPVKGLSVPDRKSYTNTSFSTSATQSPSTPAAGTLCLTTHLTFDATA